MKVLPLVGAKSLEAFRGFNALLLGLKMLPAYREQGYEAFYESFKDKTDSEKETYLREAVAFVKIEQDELEALVSFTTDKNGVPISAVNIKQMPLDQIFECVIAACMAIGRIKIYLVSSEEKKSSEISQ